MFPFPMFQTNADGSLTVPSDNYPNMKPVMHFSNTDLSFSLLPCQLLPMPTETNFSQPPNYSDPDRNNGAQIITIRMIMSGKEVGSIIGKKGDNVKRFREQSGARINISDGSSPERIVSVSGIVDKVSLAFLLICQKFEDDYIGIDKNKSEQYVCPPVTLRLLVPATQCGSIIGKGGCMIKEIREMCGASIQVASELLPSSSERSVTISGTSSAVAKCIKQISLILLETPIKYSTIQYKPKPQFSGTTQTLPHAHSIPSLVQFNPSPQEVLKPIHGLSSNNIQPPIALYQMPPSISGPIIPSNVVPNFMTDPISFGNFSSAVPLWFKHHHSLQYPTTPDILSSPPPSHIGCSQQIVEISISNDLIGCIIGRGGSTINEIRSMSGAQIKISDSEDMSEERHIIISGSLDSINTAQLLINSNIQSNRNSLNPPNSLNSSVEPGNGPSNNTTPSNVQTFPHNYIQKSKNKLPSVQYSLDGNKRADPSHYNPY